MNYHELLERFRSVTAEDIDTLYQLMIESSALQEFYETELARDRRVWADCKTHAEATKARRSKELSPKVTEGERLATADETVVRAVRLAAKAKYVADMHEVQARTCERIYFVTKEILDRAHKRQWRN